MKPTQNRGVIFESPAELNVVAAALPYFEGHTRTTTRMTPEAKAATLKRLGFLKGAVEAAQTGAAVVESPELVGMLADDTSAVSLEVPYPLSKLAVGIVEVVATKGDKISEVAGDPLVLSTAAEMWAGYQTEQLTQS